jgi:dienelactone hydrolase
VRISSAAALLAVPLIATVALTGCTTPPTSGAMNAFHEVTREQADLAGYTVYRPADAADGERFPVVLWGNGGCAPNNVEARPFLTNLAKHGFFIVAVGDADAVIEPFEIPEGVDVGDAPDPTAGPPEGMERPDTSGDNLIAALDWVEESSDGQRATADPSRVAVMGQSCGGIQALGAGADPRIDTVVAWNGSSGLAVSEAAILDALHSPLLMVTGGPDDIAYDAATADYAGAEVPATIASNQYAGHVGLFGFESPFGGKLHGVGDPGRNMGVEAVELGVSWLDYVLNDNAAAGDFFLCDDCTLCALGDEGWTVESKNWDE